MCMCGCVGTELLWIEVQRSLVTTGCRIGGRCLDQDDVLAFQKDASHRFALLLTVAVFRHRHLERVVQHEVHVLVEADDVTLDPGAGVLRQPDGDPGPVLQVPEDQVYRLDQHFLHLLVRHPAGVRE